MVKIKNPTTSGEAKSGRICFLPQVLDHKWGNGNITMSNKWGILPMHTSPQMRINIPTLQVKMKYFDLFLLYLPRIKKFSAADWGINLCLESGIVS